MNSIFRLSALVTVLFLFSNCNSFAQKKAANISAQADSTVAAASPKFNGTILISQKGKTIYSKALGFADFEKKTPLKMETQFEIMSNSKQIAAVLILREYEKGKIDLQSPIKKYLPYLTQTWADSVTVHQLLNHTHGITDLQKPLLFKPGSDFKYGNLSFNLLGKIVEYTSKKSYQEMADALFKELKMKNTFCYSKEKTKNLATGYYIDKEVAKKIEQSQINQDSYGSDGVVSTVNDLVLWNNNLHKGKILKPETYQLMIDYNIKAQHNVFGKEKTGYGYGIRIVDNVTPKYIGHTGIGDGFSSLNLYFPDSDVSLIVLENQIYANPDLFYSMGIKIKNLLLKSDIVNPK
jgi:CubicO group peptidase (beta-lactamase class C family)